MRNCWYCRSVPVLGFVNQKGGVGKTTLAVHVAGKALSPGVDALDHQLAQSPIRRRPPANGLTQSFQQPFELGLAMFQSCHALWQLLYVVSQPRLSPP